MSSKIPLTEAIERVQAFYDARCKARGRARAVLDVKQAVERVDLGVYIIRISERCLAEFGTRHKELAIDAATGSVVAINDWNPADTSQ